MADDIKYLAVTKHESELILDSMKVTNALTRGLALKAAGLVLDWDAEEAATPALNEAARVLGQPWKMPEPTHADRLAADPPAAAE